MSKWYKVLFIFKMQLFISTLICTIDTYYSFNQQTPLTAHTHIHTAVLYLPLHCSTYCTLGYPPSMKFTHQQHFYNSDKWSLAQLTHHNPSLAQSQEGWKRLFEGNAAWTSITSRIEGKSNCYWIDPISRESSHRILRYLHCLPVRHKHRRSVQVNRKTGFLVNLRKKSVLFFSELLYIFHNFTVLIKKGQRKGKWGTSPRGIPLCVCSLFLRFAAYLRWFWHNNLKNKTLLKVKASDIKSDN